MILGIASAALIRRVGHAQGGCGNQPQASEHIVS